MNRFKVINIQTNIVIKILIQDIDPIPDIFQLHLKIISLDKMLYFFIEIFNI